MTNRVMIDLETLSTEDNAAVVSIGAVVFDDKAILESLYLPLPMKGLRGHIEPSTIAWWLVQSKEAQDSTFGGERIPPHLAAYKLWEMCDNHQVKHVWANDPHFDYILLRHWWKRYREDAPIMAPVGVELEPLIARPFPFKYNTPRSYRTIVDLARQEGLPDEAYNAARSGGIKHNAMDDAASQARVIIACEQWLSRSPVPLVERMFPEKPVIEGEVADASWRDGNKSAS